MKPAMSPPETSPMRYSVALSIAASVGLFLTIGCAGTTTLAFKTVDSATDRPLAGVNTVWRMDSYDFLGRNTYHRGPANLPLSTDGGMIVVNGLYEKKTSKFVFSRNGYAPVYGVYIRGSLDRADQISSHDYAPPFDEQNFGFMASAPVSHVSATNGVFVIRMNPK